MGDSEAELASGAFPPTQWTQILEVIQRGTDDAALAALGEFCEQYRPAIYSFFRRRGCDHDQAEEYTQDFFVTRILSRWDVRKGFLFKAKKEQQRRFRSFLSHVLWACLKDQWKARRTQRGGGGKIHVPMDGLDFEDAESEAKAFAAMSCALDREIALEILRKAAGDSTRSQYLIKHFQGTITQAEAAAELGMTGNAFKQAFDRFKKGFLLNLRKEVSKLVGPEPKDIDEEIRYLMSIFSRSNA